MNQQQQQSLDEALEKTLGDGRLSGDEERGLRDRIEQLSDDREALAYARNLAFRKARARIEKAPADTLRWLDRIDKIIDNTARPPQQGGASRGTECAFSPGEHGLDLIRRELRDARKTLDICVFTITDDRVTNQIIDADRRGVGVRVVTDNDKQFDSGSDIARLVREQVPTRFDPDKDHMHHKFAVIDNQRLLTGSYNWTRGATCNHENVIVLTDADLVAAFAKEFDRLWNAFRPWSR